MEQTTLSVHQSGVLKARLVVEQDGSVRVQGDSSLIDLHATPQGTSIETDPHNWARAMALGIPGASIDSPSPEPVAAPEPAEEQDNSRLAHATSRARQRLEREKASRKSQLQDKTSLMGPRSLSLKLPSLKKDDAAASLPGSDEKMPWPWLVGGAPLLGLLVMIGTRFVNVPANMALLLCCAVGSLLAYDKLKGRPSRQQLIGVAIAAAATLALCWLATHNPSAVGFIDRITGR